MNFISSQCVGSEIKVVVVPQFADSVSEGDVRWEKSVGDSVTEDEVVCEIETDKVGIISLCIPPSLSSFVANLLSHCRKFLMKKKLIKNRNIYRKLTDDLDLFCLLIMVS